MLSTFSARDQPLYQVFHPQAERFKRTRDTDGLPSTTFACVLEGYPPRNLPKQDLRMDQSSHNRNAVTPCTRRFYWTNHDMTNDHVDYVLARLGRYCSHLEKCPFLGGPPNFLVILWQYYTLLHISTPTGIWIQFRFIDMMRMVVLPP
jgi:hypothetical protein